MYGSVLELIVCELTTKKVEINHILKIMQYKGGLDVFQDVYGKKKIVATQ